VRRYLQLDIRKPRHGEQVGNVPALARDTLVLLDAEQDMGGLAAVRDDYQSSKAAFLALLVS
jgi:hypothetical protein